MKYYVTYRINARYVAEVTADSVEDARRKAQEDYLNADFGEASDIDGEDIIVEDENGNYLLER